MTDTPIPGIPGVDQASVVGVDEVQMVLGDHKIEVNHAIGNWGIRHPQGCPVQTCQAPLFLQMLGFDPRALTSGTFRMTAYSQPNKSIGVNFQKES